MQELLKKGSLQVERLTDTRGTFRRENVFVRPTHPLGSEGREDCLGGTSAYYEALRNWYQYDASVIGAEEAIEAPGAVYPVSAF
jgi:hypothetical protein